MRSPLLASCTAATAFAAIFFGSLPSQAMTLATPAGLRAAIQQTDVKQNVHWRRGYWGYSYYRPYRYAFAYRPYYYAYRPYYAYAYPYYAYAYRPYYAYAYRPYYAYAYPSYYSYAYWPYYRPYYTYAYAYRPYYAYAYRPYYAYTYAYRPYAYGAYAYGGYRPRIWVGWGRRWW
jgi:hypothetical protein